MTTFIVMSYIIFVNPGILTSVKGRGGSAQPFGAVLTSTCIVAGVAALFTLYFLVPLLQDHFSWI